MSGASIPVHAVFGAIYGHFFLDDEDGTHALYDAVHQALKEERYPGLAQTLMDYVAGDVCAIRRCGYSRGGMRQ